MKPMPIRVASFSHCGRVREINEDAVSTLPEQGVVILADGMGGYNAGEVASRLAADTIGDHLRRALPHVNGASVLAPAVAAANRALLRAVEQAPDLQGMATTVVAGLFRDGRLDYAHVGDSRIYRFRDGRLQQLTRDHSMIQELVDQGLFDSVEEARAAGVKNNVLMRGLGIEPEVEVDEGTVPAQADDLFLFCSDGLSNMVGDDEMQETLARLAGDLEQAGAELQRRALEHGGLDNVSLVLARPATAQRGTRR